MLTGNGPVVPCLTHNSILLGPAYTTVQCTVVGPAYATRCSAHTHVPGYPGYRTKRYTPYQEIFIQSSHTCRPRHELSASQASSSTCGPASRTTSRRRDPLRSFSSAPKLRLSNSRRDECSNSSSTFAMLRVRGVSQRMAASNLQHPMQAYKYAWGYCMERASGIIVVRAASLHMRKQPVLYCA